MKIAGAGAAIAATGGVGAASAFDGLETDRVVDLGEEGLSEGDVIDPYLDEYFVDGTEVHVPEGEYDWEGRGFHRAATRNAAVIGQGEVILNTVDGSYRNTIVAEEGTIAIQNFTVRGTVEDSRNRFEAESGARVVVDNWNFPDGSVEGTSGRAFYVPGDHAGEVEFRNCYVKGFTDNGIYATSPGKGEGGKVVVDSCFVHNNNIAGIRIGGRGSTVRNCVVLNDDSAPVAGGGGRNQRGIRIGNYEHSQDMVIENVDIIHTGDDLGGGGPIRFSKDSPLSTGHMENVRIHNDRDIAAIAPKRARAEGWSGNNISVTGDGDLDVPDWFTDVCQGGNCTAPDADEPSTDGSFSDTDGSDDNDDDDYAVDDSTELVLVTTDSGGIDYTFTATDEITPLYDRDEFRANRSEPTDSASENDDGTWTATGSTGGGSGESGDSFRFEGGLLEFEVTGDVDGLTLYADGDEFTIDGLMEEYGTTLDEEEETEKEETEEEETEEESESEEESEEESEVEDSEDEDNADEDDELPTGADGELSNRIIVDGTRVDSIASYEFHVSGDIEPDETISSQGNTVWDDMDDVVDEGSVVGVVAKGIDGFRYSGELTSMSVDGVLEVTIESNDI